jgi:hypothetical protein
MELNDRPISEGELVDILIADSLTQQVKHYGIEGLEEAINRVYSHMPECRERTLAVYRKMYRYGK